MFALADQTQIASGGRSLGACPDRCWVGSFAQFKRGPAGGCNCYEPADESRADNSRPFRTNLAASPGGTARLARHLCAGGMTSPPINRGLTIPVPSGLTWQQVLKGRLG
jgi:hypothetical protein